MYILCNNFLDEYRIFQIAVFELNTGDYLFEIFSIDWGEEAPYKKQSYGSNNYPYYFKYFYYI